MATWQCVKSCGACCFLAPDDRPDLESYLTPDQLSLYLSMVGEDGWCIHYAPGDRLCTIYPDRPSFCRVTADTFEAMFGVEVDGLDDFAIDCCQEHIADIYGLESREMAHFNQTVGVDGGEQEGQGEGQRQ